MAYIDYTKSKVCKKCNTDKNVKEFYWERKKERFSTICRACNQERTKDYVKQPRTVEGKAEDKLKEQARKLAKELGFMLEMFAKNGQAMITGDNYGGYMIVTQGTRNIVAGLRYSMTAEEVIRFCKEELESRSVEQVQ